MAVDPQFVGKGIGSLLLAHAMRTMPLPIRLYTFKPTWVRAGFYSRHGFVAIEFGDGPDNQERCLMCCTS